MKISGGAWVKTRKCGCGDCASGHSDVGSGECPMAGAADAKWLWASDYSGNEEPNEVGRDSDFSVVDRAKIGIKEVDTEVDLEPESGLEEEVEDEGLEEPVLVEVASGELEDN